MPAIYARVTVTCIQHLAYLVETHDGRTIRCTVKDTLRENRVPIFVGDEVTVFEGESGAVIVHKARNRTYPPAETRDDLIARGLIRPAKPGG